MLVLPFTMLFSAEFEVTQKIEENSGHLGLQMLDDEYKYDNNDNLCALLIVRCGVKDINFSNTASKVAQIDKQGEYYITMKKGARYIVLKKEGFGSFKEHFGLVMRSGSVYEMSVDEKFKQVAQTPIIQQVNIESTPANADVFMSGSNVGKTPLKMALQTGEYDFEIKKEGYITKSFDSHSINKESNSIYANLIENIGYLELKIEPEGAVLFINNKKTPFIAGKILNLKPATYIIKVMAEGYLTKKVIAEVLLQITKKMTFDLHKNIAFYGPYIYPHDAELYVNNSLVSLEELALKPGSHKIDIKKTGFATIYDIVNLELDEVLQKDYFLKQKFVKLSLTSNIENSAFRIIENGILISQWVGNRTFNKFPIGNYKIACDAKDYSRKIDEIQLISDFNYSFLLKKGTDVPSNMAFVKGGTFQMGSNDMSSAQPVHSVTVSDFYIGKYEVTQKEWKDIMSNNPAKNYGGGNDFPVYSISWYDAIEFCNKKSNSESLTPCYTIDKRSNDPDHKESKNQKLWIVSCDFTKNGYRLPTEAEWEYAARGGNLPNGLDLRNGGKTYYEYSGSNNIGSVAWYRGNARSKKHHVGTKQPNELGVYDMSGNVAEWCWDWYGAYGSSLKKNPHGVNSGSGHVIRGGHWVASQCRVAFRYSNGPSYSGYDIGFRLLRSSN